METRQSRASVPEPEGNSSEATATAKGKDARKKAGFCQIPLPTSKANKMRACLICSLVKLETEFETEGCDNCNSFLQRVAEPFAYLTYTSANFEGLIGMISPKDSWVSKWQHISHLKPGVYAVTVRGQLDRWLKEAITSTGVPYICRDKSKLGQPDDDEDLEVERPQMLVRRRRKRGKKTNPTTVSREEDDESVVEN